MQEGLGRLHIDVAVEPQGVTFTPTADETFHVSDGASLLASPCWTHKAWRMMCMHAEVWDCPPPSCKPRAVALLFTHKTLLGPWHCKHRTLQPGGDPGACSL